MILIYPMREGEIKVCGAITTECKTTGCNLMARYDLWCWRCLNKIGDGKAEINKKYRGE